MAVRTLLLALLVASCAAAESATPSPSPSPTPSPTPEVSPSPFPSNAQGLVVEPELLDVLPAEVGGLPIVESQEAEGLLLTDANFGKTAEAVAAGLAVDPETSEFLVAIVVRLRKGQMGEERFRDWRDSYDEEACSQAGGVVGHAQAEIDGRTVYIGTCDGGVRTYHVWLAEQNLLVSASAVGEEKRLGEVLVESLRL